MEKMIQVNLKTLSLMALLTMAAPLSAFADSCSGGSCGGGGNTIQGESVDNYLAKRKVKGQELLEIVRPELEVLRAKSPKLAKDFENFAQGIHWYRVDEKLDNLPFTVTKIPFKTDQTYRQIDNDVYVNADGEKSLPEHERKTMIFHEFFQNRFLQNYGVNNNLTQGGVRRAAVAVMNAKELSAKELTAAIAAEGFDSATAAFKAKHTGRKLAMDQQTVFPVELDKPITLKNAREALAACAAGSQSAQVPVASADSALGKMLVQMKQYNDPNYVSYLHEVRRDQPMESLLPAAPGVSLSVYDSPVASAEEGAQLTFKLAAGGLLTLDYKQWKRNVESTETNFVSNQMFPILQFHFLDGEQPYDKLGLTNLNAKLSELSLSVSREVIENDWKLSFRNQGSGVMIPLSMDVKSYVDCLQEQMKARAGLEKSKASVESRGPSSVVTQKAAPKRDLKATSSKASESSDVDDAR